MNFEIGDQPGGYLLLSRCGRGAYGEVFRARSVVTGKLFALKVFPESGAASQRELAGIIRYQTVAAHSPLMQIYHAGMEADRLYYVMDLADDLAGEGGEYLPDTLQNRMARRGRIPAAELRRIAGELAEDLSLLHRKGLFHRDIKPGNIIFLNGRATLGDIGLAAADGSGTLVGTAGFLSPEVAAGTRPFAAADDFFALGKTIYCALTGNPPEKYPEFPAELRLREAGPVVILYNRWCAGQCGLPAARRKNSRRKLLGMLVAAAMPAVGVSVGVWRWSRPASAAKAGTILNGRAYWAELERLSEAYPLPEEFRRILPEMRKTKERWRRERTDAGQAAFLAPVSAAESEAMAARPGRADHPEDYVRIERQDAAVAASDAAHRDDPVWRYFELDDRIGAEITRIRALKDIPQLQNHDFSDDLRKTRELFRRRREVVAEIKKK
ncbi:MAG: protein kinase [Lentisphaeria bacterium]|nr:protein kinase [Lentisphaeria bacterium]